MRHSALDAKNYFDRAEDPIPPFTRNQYGFTLGGPVMLPKIVDGRNRLFFMVNWEGLRETKSLTATPSMPLTAWRTGDLSRLRDGSGNLIPIYDPATRVFDAAGNVLQAPTPVPSVKFGGEIRHVRYNQIGGVVTRGRFAFDGRYTQNPLLPAAQRGGAAFADFLLGDFNRAEGQVGAPIANFRSNYLATPCPSSCSAASRSA